MFFWKIGQANPRFEPTAPSALRLKRISLCRREEIEFRRRRRGVGDERRRAAHGATTSGLAAGVSGRRERARTGGASGRGRGWTRRCTGV